MGLKQHAVLIGQQNLMDDRFFVNIDIGSQLAVISPHKLFKPTQIASRDKQLPRILTKPRWLFWVCAD